MRKNIEKSLLLLFLLGAFGCRVISPDYNNNGVMDNKEIMYPSNNLAHMIDYYLTASYAESEWVIEHAIDTQGVTNMDWVFAGRTYFNLDITYWNTSTVQDMEGMFSDTKRFNQDISVWDTGRVVNMNSMFDKATAFNQDISKWDISSVKYMDYMFRGAITFNQNLSSWDVTGKSTEGMFDDTPMQDKLEWHPFGCGCLRH